MKRPKKVKLTYTKRACKIKSEKTIEALSNLAKLARLQLFPDIAESDPITLVIH